MSDEETLVSRRPRRSTAGNRMSALLAEISLEGSTRDIYEDDIDFTVIKEQEDVFESDFESTDEEAEGTHDNLDTEQAVQDEERNVRKAARTRASRATAAAHARNRATFDPQRMSNNASQDKITTREPSIKKNARRVSLGVATNAETGEVIPTMAQHRHSRRSHTMLSSSATATRLKHAEEKRAAAPKRVKTEERKYTQAELIQRALDMEEKNITDHRNYLRDEEERRRKAKVVRKGIEGPVLRWISKVEELPIPTSNDSSATLMPAWGHHSSHQAQPPSAMDTQPNGAPRMSVSPREEHPPSTSRPHDTVPSSLQFLLNPAPDDPSQLRSPSPPPPPSVKLEKITKNYLVHELSQSEDTRKPNWRQTMEALFGTHVRWDELRVYVGKGRPLSRPRNICALTGLPAKYIDPRTGVHFANTHAYQTLTRLLSHDFIWSPEQGCYVSRE